MEEKHPTYEDRMIELRNEIIEAVEHTEHDITQFGDQNVFEAGDYDSFAEKVDTALTEAVALERARILDRARECAVPASHCQNIMVLPLGLFLKEHGR